MNKKVLLEKGWLRVLIYLIIAFVCTIPIGLLAYEFNSTNTVKNDVYKVTEPLQLLSIYLSSNVGLVFAVFVCRKLIDKKTIMSLGFSVRNFVNDGLAGFFIAVLILCIGSLILVSFNYLSFTGYGFSIENLLLQLLLFVLVALVEELIFRGYILTNLMDSFNKWIALVISAVIFTLFHAVNPNINFIAIISLLVAGVLLGLNYIYTKQLWLAIFLHFGWNFFQGPILGFEVSGIKTTTVLQQTLVGPSIFTGGSFGFEASIICIFLELLTIVFLWQFYEKRYQQIKFN